MNTVELIAAARLAGFHADQTLRHLMAAGYQPANNLAAKTAEAQVDCCDYILGTVLEDDNEPVTRKSCLALGAKIRGPKTYGFVCPGGPLMVVDMTAAETAETEIYVEAFERRVTIKWSPTNRDLRYLLMTIAKPQPADAEPAEPAEPDEE